MAGGFALALLLLFETRAAAYVCVSRAAPMPGIANDGSFGVSQHSDLGTCQAQARTSCEAEHPETDSWCNPGWQCVSGPHGQGWWAAAAAPPSPVAGSISEVPFAISCHARTEQEAIAEALRMCRGQGCTIRATGVDECSETQVAPSCACRASPIPLRRVGRDCVCPEGTTWSGERCVCPEGHDWNGRACAPRPAPRPPLTEGLPQEDVATVRPGQSEGLEDTYLCGTLLCCVPGRRVSLGQCTCPPTAVFRSTQENVQIGSCECVAPLTWNEQSRMCSACPAGMLAGGDPSDPRCECPAGQRWQSEGRRCVPDTCAGGAHWDAHQRRCACPEGHAWSAARLLCVEARCSGGTQWDPASERCRCTVARPLWSASTQACEPCPGGQAWNGTACACPGSAPVWSAPAQACQPCPGGQGWTGAACACPASAPRWTGTSCAACPSGEQWDGSACRADCRVYFVLRRDHQGDGHCRISTPFQLCGANPSVERAAAAACPHVPGPGTCEGWDPLEHSCGWSSAGRSGNVRAAPEEALACLIRAYSLCSWCGFERVTVPGVLP